MKRVALSVSIGVFFSLCSCPSLFRSCGCVLMTVTEAFRGHETDLSATLTLRYFNFHVSPICFCLYLSSMFRLYLALSNLSSAVISPSFTVTVHFSLRPFCLSFSFSSRPLSRSPFFPPTPLSREAFDAELISIRLGHSSALCRSLSSEQEARSIRWLNGWIARESSSAWRDKGIFF